MTQQPPPAWSQQPGHRAPRPPQPPKKATPKSIGLGCLGVVTFLIVVGVVANLFGGDGDKDSDKPAAKAPPYQVVQQEESGNTRNVVVEVDSLANLRPVFDAVTKSLTEEAGYFVMINCSTRGTAGADNRLANGKKAVGRMGSATTGLEAGGAEFSTNAGRTCPKK
ncbi:hypothetical protein ACH419_39310 [Streptomyces bobili]|uniref:hypothetical protein n=1 Tax=Streptomyces bobili TaxID=67280 RepID=UPI0037B3D3C5